MLLSLGYGSLGWMVPLLCQEVLQVYTYMHAVHIEFSFSFYPPLSYSPPATPPLSLPPGSCIESLPSPSPSLSQRINQMKVVKPLLLLL